MPEQDTATKPVTFLGIKMKARPAGTNTGKEVPEKNANIVSRTLFSWMTPLLVTGVTRPLELDDIWELVHEHEATTLAISLEENFYARCPPSKRPLHLRPSTATPGAGHAAGSVDEKPAAGKDADADLEKASGGPTLLSQSATSPILDKGKKGKKVPKKQAADGRPGPVEENGLVYDQSLVLALNRVVFYRFWSAVPYGLIGNALTTCGPLISKQLLHFIQESYAASHPPTGATATAGPAIGKGIGLAIGLWAMQQVASLLMNQFLQRSLVTGFMLRGSLIAAVSRKSLRLSGESRVVHPNGQLITHISSDASFLDWSALLLHDLWIQPLMIIVGLGILLSTLGYSALVGLGVLLIGIPLQGFFFSVMIGTRQAQMKIVDDRVRLLQEVLQGIRVIKLMAYEGFFSGRVQEYRRQELKKLTTNCLARASMTSTMSLVPVLAAVLSFITYSLSGHDLNPAIIFASLQAFNNIRAPLFILPLAFQALSDAYVGLGRIAKCLIASEIDNPIPIRPEAEYGIFAQGDYKWETAEKPGASAGMGTVGRDRGAAKRKKKEEKEAKRLAKKSKKNGDSGASTPPDVEIEAAKPFELNNIDLKVPRGAFVVVVGRVGSGKSSLVQALIGEMQQTRGESYLGGSTSYFPQAPWVQNATLRDNILFGDANPDEKRFQEAIKACALEPDIAMLSHGLQTEIGERGINLSGGQKARVCLARAVYANADVVFLDDPLSAVDAHVSQLLVDCFVTGPLKGKTRFLVTHHLDVLPKADLVITMVDGQIAENGTYAELVSNPNGTLAKIIAEHVSDSHKEQTAAVIESKEEIELKVTAIADETEEMAVGVIEEEKVEPKKDEAGGGLMLKEERETGAVAGTIYGQYINSMGNLWRAPFFLGALVLAQAANVSTSVFLGFWSVSSIEGWTQSRYMGVYAAIGMSYSLFTFLGTFLLFLSGVKASFNLFNGAFRGVMRTPVSWHDQTPIGRVVSRLSKDITTLDDQLPMQWNQLLTQGLNVLGTVALVFYSFPYLGIIFIPLFILYYVAAAFYRASSRECKRIDSIQRSFIYASFGEMLTGMASVRAYHANERFILKTENTIDMQNRCYFVTITLQRWLAVRLDALGNILVLAISLFGVGFRNSASPEKLGVVLTYSLSLTQVFSQLVNVFAQVEQDMNTAERVIHYGNLEPEAAEYLSEDPEPSWPSAGTIEFNNVELKYREDTPAVLKGVNFRIAAGEKVGVVGRTGAGKSSLLTALFRIVELSGGNIVIDGHDVKHVGLTTLRARLGIVPQDPLLWQGKIRDNLDPEGKATDAELLSALRRCNLVPADDASPEVKALLEKFRLDAVVNDEGNNLSAGEKQLVALARVVVRNSRIIVLDEATSSVDVQTDSAVQTTIKSEFKSNTLLCVAHRLATVAYYDKIMVMDAGCVAEFDTPLTLFDREDSIFRSMCDKAALTRADIVRIRGGE